MKPFLTATVVLTLLYTSIFALPAMAAHHHDMGGGPSHCPFMIGEAALCEMNVLDHLASWQMMFSALPAELSTLVLLLLSLVLSWMYLRHLFDPPDVLAQSGGFSHRYREHIDSLLKILLVGSVISPRAP